ncbi:MAG TPA: hypothetical protein DF383_13425 [Deltaproteobacteria bacterium]|nr:hypothetical protein [Deltaproteobacteria bacterium]
MLEQMRNISGLFSKTLLAVIALSFVIYFGTRQFGRQGPEGALIAKVNDEGIPAKKFAMGVKNQNEMLQQFGQNISKEMEQVLEGQVLQRLINNTLFAQAAYRLGLRVPDVELAQEIRQNPAFRKEGKFNENFYLSQFKPFYERQYGSDYEYDLRQDLLAEKLRNVLTNSSLVSRQEVQNFLLLQGTELKINKLAVPLTGQDAEQVEAAKKTVQEWIAARHDKKASAALLKSHNLKEEEMPLQSLLQVQAAFGREDSLLILQCLLALQPGETCDQPFRVKDAMLGVELVQRKDNPIDPEKIESMTHQLSQGVQNQTLSGFADQLTRKASIVTYLK